MNRKSDFNESIRSGLTRDDRWLQRGLRWETTQLLPEERRSARRTKTYDGAEWRGIANAVSFERDRHHVEDAVQPRSSPVDTVSQYFTISWSNSRWSRNTVANSPIPTVSMYLTREWIYNSVCRSLLYCDN